MTIPNALTADVRTFTTDELHDARGTLGAAKLLLRQRHPVEKIYDQLRPLNRRIDTINDEEASRYRGAKRVIL